MRGLVRDCRASLRFGSCRGNQGFAAAAPVIDCVWRWVATAAVFAVVFGVLFRPLPYADADRLVRLWEVIRVHGSRSPARR